MASEIGYDSVLLHRGTALHGLRALYRAHRKAERFLQSDLYALGHSEGFCDALEAVAELLGLSEEFSQTVAETNSFRIITNGASVAREAG